MKSSSRCSERLLEQMWTAAEQSARRSIARLERSTRTAQVATTTLLADGPPAEAIVRAAERKRADLIVLGTHGTSRTRATT